MSEGSNKELESSSAADGMPREYAHHQQQQQQHQASSGCSGAGGGSSSCGCVQPATVLPQPPAPGLALSGLQQQQQQQPSDPSITISITPTTGGCFEITVDRGETVESLKKTISKRLKVPKERICLLYRER